MTRGQARPDLGRVSTSGQILWLGRCVDCEFGTLRLPKARATRQARAHLVAEPTHLVELSATIWQFVFGAEADG